MKNKVALSTVAQMGSQFIVAALAVVILKLLTKSLGIHSYGVYVVVIAFITAFSLLTDLGLNAITGREIAKYPDRAQNIISDNMTLRLTLSLVMIPVISGIGFLFYPHASHQLRLGILLFSFDLVLDSVRSVSLAYFSAKVKSHVSAVVATINEILFLLLVIASVLCKFGVIGIIGAFLLADFVAAVISFTMVRRKLSVRLQFRFHEWPVIAKLSVPLGIIQLVNMLYLKADSILLSILRTPTEVGYYGVSYSLISALATFPGYLMTPLIPAMAIAGEKELQRIVEKAFDIMAVFALPVAAGGFILRHQLILAVSSKPFLPAAAPFAILAFSLIFTYFNYVFGVASVAVNKYQKIIRVSIGTAILNIILNLVLIPRFGIKGAASATAITELFSAYFTYYVFKTQTGIRINPLTRVWKPLLAALLLIPIAILASPILNTSFYVMDLALGVIILGTCYFVMLYLAKGIPEDVLEIFQKIFQVPKKLFRA